MKISELINLLKELPQDARVMVSGYEEGYDDVVSIDKTNIRLNVYSEWHFGAHDRVWEDDEDVDEVAYLLVGGDATLQ